MRPLFALLLGLFMTCLFGMGLPVFAEESNPFADVPKGHWAYAAVEQLAADGIVSGDLGLAQTKDGPPLTRYEMAVIVAKALTQVDLNQADKKDVELLKKLVAEFQDELDHLGVEVDKLDSRIAVLENNWNGWKLNGGFLFQKSWNGHGK